MILENEHIVLRALEPEDIQVLYEVENDRSLWEVSHTLAPFSADVLMRYINQQAQEDIYEAKQLRLAIALKFQPKEVVGFIDLFDFDPFHKRVGVGLVLREQYRGRGWAKEALQSVIAYVFEYLGLHQMYANIGVDNEASLALFSSLGFVESGVKKDWLRVGSQYKDEAIYQLIKK